MRALWLLALAGCEIWKAPDRVHTLESRVDELTAEVSAMKGKPVGGGPSHKVGPGHEAPAEAHAAAEAPPKLVDPHEAAPDDKQRLTDLVKHGLTKQDAPHAKPHWGYDDKLGPEAWGSLDPEWGACQAGKAQSPIDISPRASTASAIEFHYKPTPAHLIDNGHTIQVGFAPGSTIEIDKHSYELVQFHVHTPSEHAVAGERFPLEVHLVHKDKAGKLAVLGVLYDVGPESPQLAEVWSHWPAKQDKEVKLRKPFDPNKLLPETRTVFRYDGSLTTPPCSEGVVWNVMRRTMTDSKGHLGVLAAHYKQNARPLQPLNERMVQ
ncbi:MAG: carbonic anhydrase family protein [Kofleriaceae bacterium]